MALIRYLYTYRTQATRIWINLFKIFNLGFVMLRGGEHLPFADEYFDCIVCNNVLDHVHNPYKILSEAWRTLKPNGLFALSVDIHSLRTYMNKKLIKAVKPDYGSLPGHPYEWTESQMTRILRDHNFEVQSHTPRSVKGNLLGTVRRTTYLLVKPLRS